MLYNLINLVTVLCGSLLGTIFNKNVSKSLSEAIMKTMGLIVVYMGITMVIGDIDLFVVISCMVIGCIIGELLRIEERINTLGEYLKKKISKEEESKFSEGFVSATILFCAGSMGIIGALKAGLVNDGSILLSKAVIDGVASALLAASFGIGVLFSAFSVFFYQSIFIILAQIMAPILSPEVINAISIVGGVIILSIGINMLHPTGLKPANLTPAVFLPIIYSIIGII
ncbi:MAG: DUF554 domain-containing protein [Tissierellia bacterium]|nr:DUF554 domain-containing protein [Tissierellia bacterium]